MLGLWILFRLVQKLKKIRGWARDGGARRRKYGVEVEYSLENSSVFNYLFTDYNRPLMVGLFRSYPCLLLSVLRIFLLLCYYIPGFGDGGGGGRPHLRIPLPPVSAGLPFIRPTHDCDPNAAFF